MIFFQLWVVSGEHRNAQHNHIQLNDIQHKDVLHNNKEFSTQHNWI